MIELINIGKNVIIAAMSIFGSASKPNQRINKGAMAIIGVTLARTAIGSRVRSSKGEWAINIPATIATAIPRKNPAKASNNVTPA
ncbi:hypothetical protein D3C81_1828170 [compost metagenome]